MPAKMPLPAPAPLFATSGRATASQAFGMVDVRTMWPPTSSVLPPRYLKPPSHPQARESSGGGRTKEHAECNLYST